MQQGYRMRGGGEGRGLTVCNKALQDERGRGGEGTDSMQQGYRMRGGGEGMGLTVCNKALQNVRGRGGGGD